MDGVLSQVLHQIRTGWLVWGVGVPREHKGQRSEAVQAEDVPLTSYSGWWSR